MVFVIIYHQLQLPKMQVLKQMYTTTFSGKDTNTITTTSSSRINNHTRHPTNVTSIKDTPNTASTQEHFGICYTNNADFQLMFTTFWPSIQELIRNNPMHNGLVG
jgi:hypothetical protein